MTRRDLALAAAAAGVLLTLPAGGRVFAIAVTFAAAIVAVLLSATADVAGPRPVVAGAAVAAIGTPLRFVVDPSRALEVVPALVCAMVLVTFLLLVVAGGRTSLVETIGSTLIVGTLVALGGGGLLLLRNGERGFRWALAVLALPLAAEAAAMALGRLRPEVGPPFAAAAVALAAVAGALLSAANPPFTVAVGLATAVVAAGAVAGARALVSSLGEGGASGGLGAAVAVLCTAAVTVLLATTVQT